MSKPILCVDFDGVIHSYTSPWTDIDEINDKPVPGALRWLWNAQRFFDVVIYSSRSKEPRGIAAMKYWMAMYATDEFGQDHPMSQANEDYPIKFAHEKPAAFLTIDDRAICFDGDFEKLEPRELIKFKPWNKLDLSLSPMAKALRAIANQFFHGGTTAGNGVRVHTILYSAADELEELKRNAPVSE